MTSRERVRRAIARQPVDRMPIDLGMHYSTGISAFAYHNLRKHLGLSTDNIQVPDFFQFLARVDEDILQRFHCDCMVLHPGWKQTKVWNPRGEYRFHVPQGAQLWENNEGAWCVGTPEKHAKMPAGGFFFDGGYLPLEDISEDERLDRYAREAERVFKETDYYTMYIGYSAYFYGTDVDYLCNMLTDPDIIIEGNERQSAWQLENVGKVIDKFGRYIQGICINSDLGNQGGPMCSPVVWEELCAPYVKRFCDFVHQNSDLKIFLHTCGSMREFIPGLIRAGVDIINPVQISAANMDPAALKRDYGEDIVFWGGGCNTQTVLGAATPAEVAQNVRELISVFKPGRGFVFNQVHNIMGNVPPENIVAMLDTAYENSFY
ncbi:MAG: hypothetical protein FWD16_04290 [Clostridia bacterium]|nr:hypothetical protein [Clostridia bacterium]